MQWVYNKNDTLMKTIDENGAESVFTYNQDKLVEKICNPEGEAIMLTYDGHKNLSKVVLPNGCISDGNTITEATVLAIEVHWEQWRHMVMTD